MTSNAKLGAEKQTSPKPAVFALLGPADESRLASPAPASCRLFAVYSIAVGEQNNANVDEFVTKREQTIISHNC